MPAFVADWEREKFAEKLGKNLRKNYNPSGCVVTAYKCLKEVYAQIADPVSPLLLREFNIYSDGSVWDEDNMMLLGVADTAEKAAKIIIKRLRLEADNL